jgi:hypothetical protein
MPQLDRSCLEAIDLGNDLAPANEKAFETIHSTKLIAKQLDLMT